MKSFSVNIVGRVNNYRLPLSNALMPLYEAVINSIQAIDEANRVDNGCIKITAMRDPKMNIEIQEGEAPLNQINAFIIEDNGIGFNEKNIESFCTSDSGYKSAIGGKGVGRFTYLKAFNNVKIASVFIDENGEYAKRTFAFEKSDTEIDDVIENASTTDTKTVVELNDYLDQYKRNCPVHLEKIAIRVIQHCIVYFLHESCPDIVLVDGTGQEDTINLNRLFEQKIAINKNQSSFEIEAHQFEMLHLKFYDNSATKHQLIYCANGREVKSVDLSNHIIDLSSKLLDEKNQPYYYTCILTSNFFDKRVDMNRLTFSIPSKRSDVGLINEISLQDIEDAAMEYIEQYLLNELYKIREQKQKRIQTYINSESPRYRHLLKYEEAAIRNIRPGISNDKLDDELYRINRKFSKKIQEDNKNVMHLLKDEKTKDSYARILENHMSKVNDYGKSTLAEYVTHRKAIVDLLTLVLQRNDGGKYEKEAAVHEIIFPMHKTSEDIEYFDHNLWLIDEKLSYHNYLASDVPFNNDRGEKRPDILICDKPVAVSDTDESIHQSIVIFELKKPERSQYSDADNPINQVLDYVNELKTNKKKNSHGRTIRTDKSTRFYLYILCDINEKLDRFALLASLNKTPDRLGYYGYFREMNAYCEIIPYDKLLDNAKKRNKILFERLNI